MSKGRCTLGDKLQDHACHGRGDTSQRQIASCVLENFWENLCFCNRILSQQHVEKNQIRQNLCDLLRRQKFCCRCKDFHKNSRVHMKRFVTPMCRRNVLLQLVARSVHTEWFVVATCRLVCSELKHRIDQSQSGKLSAWSHAQSSPPTSSETQGQLVGSIKCSWWKFTVRSSRLDLTVNFHHEHFIDPTNCPWVAEDAPPNVAFSFEVALSHTLYG